MAPILTRIGNAFGFGASSGGGAAPEPPYFTYTRLLVNGNPSPDTNVKVPNADITLNGGDLISAGQAEKEGLITELKEILDTMSRQAQLERKAAESTAMQDQMNKIPLKIYIG